MTRTRLRDGPLRHRCDLPHWFDTKHITRGVEWVCFLCGQVWIAKCTRPVATNGDWVKLRAGFWRRPVKCVVTRAEEA